MVDWSNEMAMEFLELYAAEPVLYDPKHPYYKNKKMINNAWLRIQQGFRMSMPLSEFKKKKDSLMASFRYQMRKKKELILVGESVFKPAWFAFDFMYGFLGQIYENEFSNNAEDSEPILEFIGFDELDDSPNAESSPTTQDSNIQEVKFDDEKPELNSLDNKKKTASKRKQPLDTQIQEALLDQTSTASRSDDEDECDLYGKLIAKKLKKLPEGQRERLMYEIQGLFMKGLQFRLS